MEDNCVCILDKTLVCGNPAIAIITFGCIHEHIHSNPTCKTCLAYIEQILESNMFYIVCNDCMECSDPHECTPKLISKDFIGEQVKG